MLDLEKSDSPLTLENSLYFIAPKQREELNQLFTHAIKTGEGFIQIFECVDRLNVKRWLNIQATTERDAEQNINRVFGSCQDVTSDRVKLETKIQEAEYVQHILDNLNDAIVITDINGKITDLNAITCNLFGYAQETMCGLSLNALMAKQDARLYDSCMENYLRTGNTKIIEVDRLLTGVRADNTNFPMTLSLSDTAFNDERFFIVLVRDSSESTETQSQ